MLNSASRSWRRSALVCLYDAALALSATIFLIANKQYIAAIIGSAATGLCIGMTITCVMFIKD